MERKLRYKTALLITLDLSKLNKLACVTLNIIESRNEKPKNRKLNRVLSKT